ncbi:MAG: RusA family crossover junction endodeoxyribonuclease [Devosia sp.]|nr:RusA family crossover junction endodeoxyribonuclease [Devosia sp.]
MEGLARAGLFTLWLAGKPVTASRPRFSKKGFAYTAKPYREWLNANWKAIEAMDSVPTDRPIALLIEVGIMRPKKTAHSAPMGDTDNLSKGPMDLVTKGGKAWLDDRQIVFQATAKRWVDTEDKLGSRLWWCEVEMD